MRVLPFVGLYSIDKCYDFSRQLQACEQLQDAFIKKTFPPLIGFGAFWKKYNIWEAMRKERATIF